MAHSCSLEKKGKRERGGMEEWREGRRKRKKKRKILHLKRFYLEVSGEDLNRIFISFPGVVVSTDWSAPGQGNISH